MGNRRTAVMAGMAVLATCFSWGFSFNDIHYWVGEGSKKCGVVIDWGKAGQIRAWGYKWTSSTSGCGTNLVEIVRNRKSVVEPISWRSCAALRTTTRV